MLVSPSARILIIKLSSLGDVVHALPVAAALRRRYPQAHLAWAVKPPAAELLAGHPYLDDVLVIGGQKTGPGMSALPPLSRPAALAAALRARRFEVAVDLQGLFKTAVLSYLSGAPERIGFHNLQEGAGLLCNRRIVPDRRDRHAVEAYFGFAAALEAPVAPVEFALAISEEDRQYAATVGAGQEPLIAIIPGARWNTKQWPPERFAAVVEALHREFGTTALVVGAGGDAPLAARLRAATSAPVLDLTGRTTLKQAAALFPRCAITVSTDTGPMHLSAMMGTPTVAVFGPTNPRRFGPYGEGHAIVWAHVPCAPCRRRECRSVRCLEEVTPEQVLEAARPRLAARLQEAAHGR